ncbi:MAG: group II truncated hemoglobin [Burkholderiales bacterium]|nr:group II truncated hemoglobin [Burkholderiales bacterium]
MSGEPSDANAVSAFDRLGGEPAVRALVDRFYDLMDLDPAFAALRALHPTTLDASRDKLFWFLCGWLGGPQHYTDRVGHPMLRARHLPFSIGVRERDQWLACMHQAMTELQFEPQFAQRLGESFFATADWMRNRRAD